MFRDKCEECQIGLCKPISMTYMRRAGSHMILLPDAPATRCDMCGEVKFDSGFLLTMQVLLEKMTEKRSKGEPKKTKFNDRQQNWTPVRRGG